MPQSFFLPRLWIGSAGLALLAACAGGRPAPSPTLAQPAPNPPIAPAPPPVTEVTPPLGAELVVEPIVAGEGSVDTLEEEHASEDSSPGDRLQAALEAYELSAQLWSVGDLDATLDQLDRAYALMASVEPGEDPGLAQDKESLRQLLARRIVELYASRRNGVGNEHEAIPLEVTPEVEREILSFQTREREHFLEAYRRSGLYRTMILEELAKAGLPEGLSWLPLVESLFKERALSSARAAGLWQFIASTGYRYSLRRTDWIDERFDPLKSTRAAIGYLTDLHALFGDWLTALAAYNCGEGAVLREIKRQPTGYFDRFWDLYARLPQETRRYVPRLIATLLIVQEPARFGFELPTPFEPVIVETVDISRSVALETLDRHLGLPVGTLAQLNPELRRNASPPSAYPLRVPAGHGPTVLSAIDALPAYKPQRGRTEERVASGGSHHRVRAGDTLSSIAARYGVSPESLARANGISDPRRLQVGQSLRIPGRRAPAAEQQAEASQPPRPASRNPAGARTIQYRVRPGDNLWAIASRFGTTVEQLKADNRLASNLLQPGQVLTIRSSG